VTSSSSFFHPKLARELASLAIPVIISQLSQTVVGLVDTMMVGRISVDALAATGLAGLAIWMIMGALGHLSTGVQIIVARRIGENRPEAAAHVLLSALKIVLPLGLILHLVAHLAYPYYFSLVLGGTDNSLHPICTDYALWRIAGLLPFLLIAVLKGFFNGKGDTKQHMRVALIINAFNIFFNWVFIFGHLGAPAMGAPGAGLASMLSTFIGAIWFLIQASQAKVLKTYGLSIQDIFLKTVGAAENAASIVRLALPASIQAFLVLTGFSAFIGMMKVVGTAEVAATNVVFTILSFSFMPGFGIGMAASTLIGQKLGAKKKDEARQAGYEAQKLGLLVMCTMGLIFILFPDPLLRLFTDDVHVLEVGKLPLQILGAMQFFDSLAMTTAGCLEGAGLTKFVMWSEVLVHWLLFLPLSAYCILVLGTGILPPFFVLALYMVAWSLIMQWRFRKDDWVHRTV
jgi:multidrug resistance protein, MATE family